jgi:hypothetical protein
MSRSIVTFAAVALGLAMGFAASANAEPAHARHAAASSRQIVVHARESFLTAGTNAPVGSMNNYVLSTFGGGAGTFVPFSDGTTGGVRGLERMPTNFTVPGCCVP